MATSNLPVFGLVNGILSGASQAFGGGPVSLNFGGSNGLGGGGAMNQLALRLGRGGRGGFGMLQKKRQPSSMQDIYNQMMGGGGTDSPV